MTDASLYGSNLNSANLSGADLTGVNLEADLTNANLRNANLTRTRLSESLSTSGATLSGADLTGATVAEATLSSHITHDQLRSTASYAVGDLHGIKVPAYADWTAWDLSNQNLTGAVFANVNLTNANLNGATIKGANFTSSHLAPSQLYSTASYQSGDLRNIRLAALGEAVWDFSDKDLRGAFLGGMGSSNLTGADLTGATVADGIQRVNFRNAIVVEGEFRGITSNQLSTTASYQAHDLHGIRLRGSDLSGLSLAGQNLAGAELSYETNMTGTDFSGAIVANADFRNSNLAADQLYGTASYQVRDLHGILLDYKDLTGWNLAHQDLTGASFWGGNLVGADLTDAIVAHANFAISKLSADQLYSTASYQARDLRGVNLHAPGADEWTMDHWDMAGQNLAGATLSGKWRGADFTGACLVGADLTSANLTDAIFCGADLRGAVGIALENNDAVTCNTIMPDGTLTGLTVKAGEVFTVRNGSTPIKVLSHMTFDPQASLEFAVDGKPWNSTISFDSGIPVVLGGELELRLAPTVLDSRGGARLQPVGESFPYDGLSLWLFDWSDVNHVGQFRIVTDSGTVWDTSSLYTTGHVTLLGVPEPSSLVLASVAAIIAFCFLRRRK